VVEGWVESVLVHCALIARVLQFIDQIWLSPGALYPKDCRLVPALEDGGELAVDAPVPLK